MTNALPSLDGGRCVVVWARPDNRALDRVDLLDPIERIRRDRYHREIDRLRFTVGAVLARLLLAALPTDSPVGDDPAAIAMDRNCGCGRPHGRPRSPGSGIELSITHAGDWVGIACGTALLGLDIEPVERTDLDSLRAMILSPHEYDHTGPLIDYWIRKEAVLKATGEGLAIPMTALTVSAPADPPALLRFDGRPRMPGRTRLVRLGPDSDHRAALAALDTPALTVTEILLDDSFTGFGPIPNPSRNT